MSMVNINVMKGLFCDPIARQPEL